MREYRKEVLRVSSKLFKNPIYKYHRELLLWGIDIFIVLVSFFLAYWIKIDFEIPDFDYFNFPKAILSITTLVFVYSVSFRLFRIHKSLWKYIGQVEAYRIGMSVLCSSVVLLVCVLVSHIERFYLGIVVTGGLLSTLMMFNVRLIYRTYRKHLNRSEVAKRNALIIGAGDGGYLMLKELTQNEKYNVNVVGFIDDKKIGSVISGYKVLGDTYDIPSAVSKYDVQCAFIAIPSADKENIRRIYDICQSVKLETKIMKDTHDILDDSLKPKNIPLHDISIEDLLGRGEVHLDQSEIKSYLTDRIVAVTGAGGSIGSELCRQIVRFKPKKLVMIDINENYLYMLEQEFNRNRTHGLMDKDIEIVSIITSIRDFTALTDVFKKYQPEVVFHAAAHKHVPLMETRPWRQLKHVLGQYVIKACIKNKFHAYYDSTDKAVNPTNVMGASKRMTE